MSVRVIRDRDLRMKINKYGVLMIERWGLLVTQDCRHTHIERENQIDSMPCGAWCPSFYVGRQSPGAILISICDKDYIIPEVNFENEMEKEKESKQDASD